MGRAFGPRFGAGDTVGCGICLQTGALFYALNGRCAAAACIRPAGRLSLTCRQRHNCLRDRVPGGRVYVLTSPLASPPAPDRFVGVACDSWISNRPLYPVIGVGSFLTGRLSFGQHRDAPFVFDVGTWPR
eukprot:COSAG01_NODE_23214_length_823_cov_21.640884_2_plen_130_part_00